MSTLTLPPIQYDPDIDNCLHNINLNMTPTEDQPNSLQQLALNNLDILSILTSYTAGLAMGTWLT